MCQLQCVDCIGGVVVVGGVGQDGEFGGWYCVQQVGCVWILVDVDVVDCYCDDFGIVGDCCCMGFVEVFVFVVVYQQV